MKKLLLLGLFLSTHFSVFSQIPVGHYYDVNGTPMHGYFDPLEYAPEEMVNLKYERFNFYKGHYYDRQGMKHEGFLKFNYENFYFKEEKSSNKEKKIKTRDFKSFVINNDSFFVFSISATIKVGQYISSANGYTFVKQYGKVSAMSTEHTSTFYAYKEDKKIWYQVPSSTKGFREAASTYFDNIPLIKERLENKEFDYYDFYSLIKMSKYYEYYLNNQAIYFNEKWIEVTDKEIATYEASITSVKDSVWSLEYKKKGKLLYEGEVTRFMPLRFHNEFTSYYENGNLRKKTIYKDGKVKEVTTYYPNGEVHYNYNEFEIKNNLNGRRFSKKMRTYNLANDINGINILASDNKGTEEYKDDLSGNDYIKYFQMGQLQYAYREENGSKIYSFSDLESEVKINRLSNFISKINMSYFLDEIEVGVSDILLVKVVIDEDGRIESFNFLNEIDDYVSKKVEQIFLDFKERKKFSEYELPTGDIVKYEVLIPININISSFNDITSPFKNWYYHNMWMQNHMMNNMPLNIQAPPGFGN